ncbi:MAG: right-handed parallel beta-helix repeat-containing protein [Kiritimatiellae bacterium]|nr:right-handed parallel beta-helix repeat-containing protein [Kiritimatiellia bacterium]
MSLTHRCVFLSLVLLAFAALPCARGTEYFVNDGSTNGDVYCTAVGASTNSGTNAASPKVSLQEVIGAFGLKGGDIVYVDAGTYTNSDTSFWFEGGVATNYLAIQGSTNPDGPTVFDPSDDLANQAIYFNRGSFIDLRDLTLQGCRRGMWSTFSDSNRLTRVTIRDVSANGIYTEAGEWWKIAETVFAGCGLSALNGDSAAWECRNCVFLNSPLHYYFRESAANTTNLNCVFLGGTVIGGSVKPLAGDYNVFWNTLLHWRYPRVSDLGQPHSTWVDPQFVDAGAYDFHPKSVVGHWCSTGWVPDTVHSALIDLGYPQCAYSNEPPPNGTNINAGIYGNTWQASKSRTNAWLFARTFNDGGDITGTGVLYWAYGNFTNGAVVRLDYSPDGGTNWYVISNNVPATNGHVGFTWKTAAATSSPIAYWRVVNAATGAADTNDAYFSLRGIGQLKFYVNDTGVVDDVYCSTTGSVYNSGLSSNAPVGSLYDIVSRYDLGPGDVVYVDTGHYVVTNMITIGPDQGGNAASSMTIMGSTDEVYGGTVLDRQDTGADALRLRGVQWVSLRNLAVCGARCGVWLYDSHNTDIEGVTARNNVVGFRGDSATANRFTRCLLYNNTTGLVGFTSGNIWGQGVCWGNTTAFALDSSTAMSISNSVISGGTAFGGAGISRGDYNIFWDTGLGYASLNEFQKAKGWWYCTYADPLFVDPTVLDFHPRSVTGTYSNGVWPVYTNHSPCIDLGAPTSVYTNELPPNGSNVNIGIYGNTPQASKSRTNAWLVALNYQDGGTLTAATDTTDRVYWRSAGLPSGATVRIELSRDSGKPGTWEVVVTGLLASSGYYTWTSTNQGSCLSARWRVVYEVDTNIYGATTHADFSFRSGRYEYFVNDYSRSGDMYCQASGSDAKSGVSPFSPKYSVAAVITNHDLEPGDIIYVDTGQYLWGGDQRIDGADGGNSNEHVSIIGSTNTTAGGSVIDRDGGSIGFYVNSVTGISIRNITVVDASTAFYLLRANDSMLEDVTARSCSYGFYVSSSTNVTARRCLAAACSSYGLRVGGAARILFEQGVLWRSGSAGVYADNSRVAVTNSVIVASGSGSYCYYARTPSNIDGDYNDVYPEGGARAGYIMTLGRAQDTLSAWVGTTTQEVHSLSADPLFFAAANGDFHVLSKAFEGRYVTGAGWIPGFDNYRSPLIDSGSRAASYGNEPFFNGGRVNIGLYGNTPEASKSRTNAWLHAASLRQGGWIKGSGMLHWVAGGDATGHTVAVDFSPDGGRSWSVLTNGVPAAQEEFAWDTTRTNDTPAGVWRIRSLDETNVTDETTVFFAIRNANLKIFVNDRNTTGDVYTTAIGSPTNWAAASNCPLDSLAGVFPAYDIEPGDVIYIDTGGYTSSVNAVLGYLDAGTTGMTVSLVGSTNEARGGSVIHRGATTRNAHALEINGASWITVSNLSFRGGDVPVRVSGCSDVSFDRVRFAGGTNGLEVTAAANIRLHRIASADNLRYGIFLHTVQQAELARSVLWSNGAGAVYQGGGWLSASNNVLTASGAGRYVFRLVSNAVLKSDYNDILHENGAHVAVTRGWLSKYLIRWNEDSTNDLYSLSHPPLYHEPSEGDFHPMSRTGRYDLAAGTFVVDTVTSPLIDTGDPAHPFGNETLPNGSRANIGLYGNDVQASRSPLDGRLYCLTLNDGGSVKGSNVVLRWVAAGVATGHQVYIDCSFDDRNTWTNIATNIPANTSTGIVWDTLVHGSEPITVWRVVSQTDSNVYDETDENFAVKNGALAYFVNDGSTNGDVYTTIPGLPYNDGRVEWSPLDSIASVLAKYDLEPGDQILVDTGTYPTPGGIVFGSTVRGFSTNIVVIQGSTNQVAGGSVLDFTNAPYGILLSYTERLMFRHLRLRGGAKAVRVADSSDCTFEWVWARDAGNAFEVEVTTNIVFHHCAAVGSATNGLNCLSSTGTLWRNGVLWSNVTAVRVANSSRPQVPSTWAEISHTVIGSFGPGRYAYTINAGSLVSDYNDVFLTNGAWAAIRPAGYIAARYDSVSRWSRDTGQDVHSLTLDPLLFDIATNDFHPRSKAGRYSWSAGGYVYTDGDTSPLVDAGDPSAACTNEPGQNGRRNNIGLYGDSREASQTPTNGSLSVITLNDGGRVEGISYLCWVARGAATAHTVRLRFSWDGGTSWSNITLVPAVPGEFLWDTALFSNTLFGVWEIYSTNNPGISDRSDKLFAVRNSFFDFYVNDGGTNGDVYTWAVGALSNNGLSRLTPLDSLHSVISTYDLEVGDTIYVDTGVYTSTSPLVIDQQDADFATNTLRMTIQGSTNYGTVGTVLQCAGANDGIRVSQAASVGLRDLTIRDAATGVRQVQTRGCRLERIRIERGTYGFDFDYARDGELRRCVARNIQGAGLRCTASSNVIWDSGILWSNTLGVVLAWSSNFGSTVRSHVFVSNSVIGAYGPNRYAYHQGGGSLICDYNDVVLQGGAYAGFEGGIRETVSRWATGTGRDRHTLSHDPGFFDAGSGDFHPVSIEGRWSWSITNYVTTDTNTSLLVDAGSPDAPYGAEPSPNGMRVNIGLYGNTNQASKTPTNSSLTCVSLNDGGVAQGSSVMLYWVARGDATGHTVRLEYSGNGGKTWTFIATNEPGVSTHYWDVSGYTSTMLGVWMVTSVDDTSVWDRSDHYFAVRNGPLPFFVNDASTNGDIYCQGPGVATNYGLLPEEPKATIQGVLEAWDLEAGDVIYVDTGFYTNLSDTVVGELDAGNTNETARVVIRGSTNEAAGGSVMVRVGSGNGILLTNAYGVEIRDLTFRGGTVGVRLQGSDDCRIEGIRADGAQLGVSAAGSDGLLVRHCVIQGATIAGVVNNGSLGLLAENNVLWSNAYGVSVPQFGSVCLRDSVVGSFGADACAYSYSRYASFTSDYNCVFLTNGAFAAHLPDPEKLEYYTTLSRFVRDTGLDRHSLSHDPLFHNAAGGDFHPLSTAGRYDVTAGVFVADSVTSPLIDAGTPGAAYTNETALENGLRRNIGLYGNSTEASWSPTNADVIAVSLNDGGRAEGGWILCWVARGDATGHVVTLEFSGDNGGSWDPIVTNWTAGLEYYVWNTRLFPSTPLGIWRIVSENEGGVEDQTDKLFALHNEGVSYYVNDAYTNGDVYTQGPGDENNLGADPSFPLDTLARVLEKWDVEPGDTIYVDTGSYDVTDPITIGRYDAWDITNTIPLQVDASTNLVTIQGSTNLAGGGTVLDVEGGGNALVVGQAPGVAVRHLEIRDAHYGLFASASPYGKAEWVTCRNGTRGFEVSDSSHWQLLHCVSKANQRGLSVSDSAGTIWRHGILWSNSVYGVYEDRPLRRPSSLTVENSVIGAFGANVFAYFFVSGAWTSDYNDVFLQDGAFAGGATLLESYGSFTQRYQYVSYWSRSRGQDEHSLTHDPGFYSLTSDDYHLRTTQPEGRYDPLLDAWTNDTDFSRLIDSGKPGPYYTDEPWSNGHRVNIGLYGGTWEASKTPTGGWFTCISYNDGGRIEGEVWLRWVVGDGCTGCYATLDFSPVAGEVWTNIATHVPASLGQWLWDSTTYGRSFAGIWRVTCETHTNVFDTSFDSGDQIPDADQYFVLTTNVGGSVWYFVNDADTNCDVYCTAPGICTNKGYSPDFPACSVRDIISARQLQQSDRVYVDTGVYEESGAIRITDVDSGAATNPVLIIGSTNAGCGGTVFDRKGAGGNVLEMDTARGVEVRNVSLRDASVGAYLSWSEDITFDGVRSEYNKQYGAYVDRCNSVTFRHSALFYNGGTGGVGLASSRSYLSWENGVIWGNASAVSFQESPSNNFRNSALQAEGLGHRVFVIDQGTSVGSINSEYNNLVRAGGALVAEKAGPFGSDIDYETLVSWQRQTGHDVYSLSHNPEFLDGNSGRFDLRSRGGRFLDDGTLTNDNVTSPMIDMGDPASDYGEEQWPNGERVNIGMYGNTWRASLSQTNPPWLLCISLNDGGTIWGSNNMLRWASGGMTNGTTIRVEYSPNNGIEWSTLVSNMLAGAAEYEWDVSDEPPSALCRWRVVSESGMIVTDVCDEVFSIKNDVLTIYVNDDSTNNDCWCTRTGDDTLSGITNTEPMRDVVWALRRYPLGPGDTVYIDTGLYDATNSLLLNELTKGESGAVIRVRGCTNVLGGGAVIDRGGSGYGIEITDTRYVDFDHLRVRNATVGVYARNTLHPALTWIEAYSNTANGVFLSSIRECTLDRSASWNNNGWGIDMADAHVQMDSVVLSSNRSGGVQCNGSSVRLYNSVVQAAVEDSYVYSVDNSSLDLDYNVVWRGLGAKLGRDAQLGIEFTGTFDEWQRIEGVDEHSLLLDPLFGDGSGGDFHLLSQAGRFDPSNAVFVTTDTNTSWAIDAGDPSSEYEDEPDPDGLRRNVGLHGGTLQASKSVTNAAHRALRVISLRDGGVVSGSKTLVWLHRAMTTADCVTLEYSVDDGRSWTVITSGVSATSGSYPWDASSVTSVPRAYWKVTYETVPSIFDTNEVAFWIKNSNFVFYVNDTVTNGDIYATAPGHPTNLGYFADSPLPGVQEVLDRYDLDGGDRIMVDTGTYPITNEICFTSLDSGVSTSRVCVIGSTNTASGGSLLYGTTTTNVGMRFRQGWYVAVSDLTFSNCRCGIAFELNSAYNVFSNIVLRDGGGDGILLAQGSGYNRFEHVVVNRYGGIGVNAAGCQNNTLVNCVIWSNNSHAIKLNAASLNVFNSVLFASGPGDACYYVVTNAVVVANYNDLVVTNFAVYGDYNGVPHRRLPQWSLVTSQDLHSLSIDPKFADPVHGDFHLLSPEGRYADTNGGYIFTDTQRSFLIDSGSPDSSCTNEPSPNASLVNIGAHGNTREASLSRVDPWLMALMASSGGRLEGSFYLTWNAVNIDPTNKVALDYSYDDGSTWTNIFSGVVVTNRKYLWHSATKHPDSSEKWPSSPLARWRVVLEADTNIWDITDTWFALRNTNFTYYVNDADTNGDIYCTAIGLCTNLGIFPHIPKGSLRCLLDDPRIDLEGNDIVYIDTGLYLITTGHVATVGAASQGEPGKPVYFRGNTNAMLTVFDRAAVGGPLAILVIDAQHIDLSHMQFVGGSLAATRGQVMLANLVFTNGDFLVDGPSSVAEDVQVIEGIVTGLGEPTLRRFTVQNGRLVLGGTNGLVEEALVYGTNNPALRFEGESATLRNLTLATAGNQYEQWRGDVTLENSILTANGANRFCIRLERGTLNSDYNNLTVTNGAWIGNCNGLWQKLVYWQRESGNDLHSMSAEPFFADPGAGDFHLQSVTGRWNGAAWTNDLVHSPCIDAGNPAGGVGSELSPNGGRVNLGAYGGTTNASKSLTGPWLVAMSMNDGGVLKGTKVIRWNSGNLGTGDLVRLDYSWDSGTNWTTFASGLSATDREYAWNTTTVTSSLFALWRVVLQTNTLVQDQVDQTFAVRNVPLKFYVNDTTTNNDVYCNAVGAPGKSGLASNLPKLSIQGILDAYDTEALDTIYVDAGTYNLSADTRIIWSRGGDDAGNLVIQGSTNSGAAATIVSRGYVGGGSAVFDVRGSHVAIRDITAAHGYYGVRLDSNRYCSLARMMLCSNAFGVLNNLTIGVTNRNLRVWKNAEGGIDIYGGLTTVVENCTFVGNPEYGVRVRVSANNRFQNNIFYVDSSNTVALAGDSNVIRSAFIDYNVYYFPAPTSYIWGTYNTLIPWQLYELHDYRSAITNPGLVNVVGGDFHLRSTAGRYLDGYGWTTDVTDAWGIDKGNPDSDYSLEPHTNSARANVGAYGNTEHASKSTSNAVVYVRMLNDYTEIGPTNSYWPLIWTAINVPPTETFRVQYSGDNGINWVDLAVGQPAYQEFILWQTVPYYNTFHGRWRVVGESNTNYWDVNDDFFRIFYGTFAISKMYQTASRKDIVWRGAWDEMYQVQYTTNIAPTNSIIWVNAPDGPQPFQKANFISTNGGDFIYEDIESTNDPFRMYRVLLQQQ